MKLLTVTTLFPNGASPNHGVFVENRLAAWRRQSGDDARVIAPVPQFPSRMKVFGRYARYAAAPQTEKRLGVEVRHPRYLLLPWLAATMAPSALAAVFERAGREMLCEGYDFDLLDAHYLYPDGVAAVRAAERLKKPVVLTARGSDVTRFAHLRGPGAMILDAIRRADAVVAVAGALKRDLVSLGAPAEKIAVLPNGVDLDRFRPADRAAIRERMGLSGAVIASVGSLIARKGHDLVIEAIAALPDTTLLIAGAGPMERPLRALAKRIGVSGRVRFLGEVAHDELPPIYNAADALVLASTHEGWPNVLLEAIACGTPAIATDAGGCSEVILAPEAGCVVSERTSRALAAAIQKVLATTDRDATRAYATRHSWDETSKGLSRIYASVNARARAPVRYLPAVLATAASTAKPKLLFTVDSEESFDWNDFSPGSHCISPPRDIGRLQRLCEEFGVRPLYFITYPLLVDAECAGYFRALSETEQADLGVHLHQWTTPPFGGFQGEYYSWQGNLPSAAHAEKLRALASAFERAFGVPPIAHRAGRYGISRAAYREIAALGLQYDFSPSVGFDFSEAGGPDFSTMTNEPFIAKTDCGDVFVIPVCGARAIRGGQLFLRQKGQLGLRENPRPLPVPLTAPFRLSSEGARFGELVSLTRFLADAGAAVLTFSLHSTTMTPGGNPYAPDAAAVDSSLSLIRRYLDFFINDFGGEAIGLSDLAAFHRDRPRVDSAAFKLNPPLSAFS